LRLRLVHDQCTDSTSLLRSDDESLAAQHARRNAQKAVNAAKDAAAAFDAAAKAQLAAADPAAPISKTPFDRQSLPFALWILSSCH